MTSPTDAQRARRADRLIPPVAPETRAHRLELEPARRSARACMRFSVMPPSAKCARLRLTQPMYRLSSCLAARAFADDELGAAAADVDDQPATGLARHRVRDAEIDEARLLDAGDDFDRVAERLARAIEECALAPRPAQRVGADDAHAARACMSRRRWPNRSQAGERALRSPRASAGRARRGRRRGAPSRAADRGWSAARANNGRRPCGNCWSRDRPRP